jgi:hypothetical protein
MADGTLTDLDKGTIVTQPTWGKLNEWETGFATIMVLYPIVVV